MTWMMIGGRIEEDEWPEYKPESFAKIRASERNFARSFWRQAVADSDDYGAYKHHLRKAIDAMVQFGGRPRNVQTLLNFIAPEMYNQHYLADAQRLGVFCDFGEIGPTVLELLVALGVEHESDPVTAMINRTNPCTLERHRIYDALWAPLSVVANCAGRWPWDKHG